MFQYAKILYFSSFHVTFEVVFELPGTRLTACILRVSGEEEGQAAHSFEEPLREGSGGTSRSAGADPGTGRGLARGTAEEGPPGIPCSASPLSGSAAQSRLRTGWTG